MVPQQGSPESFLRYENLEGVEVKQGDGCDETLGREL